jgi:hypothetical protein
MAEAFRNRALEQASEIRKHASGFRKLAPGCNASILAGSTFLHPGASFRNPEARFRISKARSEARFLNEPAPSGVPRVEWGGALPVTLICLSLQDLAQWKTFMKGLSHLDLHRGLKSHGMNDAPHTLKA